MSELRTQLKAAQAAHRSARYPGDLADELLAHQHRRLSFPHRAWWLPLVTSAVAAMVAIALWPHRPVAPQPPKQIVTTAPTPSPASSPVTPPVAFNWSQSVPRFENVEVETYVTHVQTGMKEAVSKLETHLDVALDAPLVSDSVATVRHVAGDLQEIALVTWSQVCPR